MLESPEPDKTKPSVIQAAASLGRKRFRQGYSAPLIVTTVRLLQRAIYEVARENLSSLERSILPLDLKRLNSSLAMQLEAALEGFLNEYVA